MEIHTVEHKVRLICCWHPAQLKGMIGKTCEKSESKEESDIPGMLISRVSQSINRILVKQNT